MWKSEPGITRPLEGEATASPRFGSPKGSPNIFFRKTMPRRKQCSFGPYLNVVLIPTRHEYKTAECDLWWEKKDFLDFHKGAVSELKLFTVVDGGDFKEAKRKLYQPEECTPYRLNFLNASSASNSRTSSLDSNESREDSGFNPGFSPIKQSRSKDIPDPDEWVDEYVQEEICWICGLDSKCHCSSSVGGGFRNVFHSVKNLQELEEKLLASTMKYDDFEDDFWNFCVPLQQKSVVMDGNDIYSNDFRESNPQSGFSTAAIMGFLSMAIPLGYYVFHIYHHAS